MCACEREVCLVALVCCCFACDCVLELVVCRVRFARVSCPWLRFEYAVVLRGQQWWKGVGGLDLTCLHKKFHNRQLATNVTRLDFT